MLTDTAQPPQRCHGPLALLTIDTALAQQKNPPFDHSAPDSAVSFSNEKETESKPVASNAPPEPLISAFARRLAIGREREIKNSRCFHSVPGGLVGSSRGVLEQPFSSSTLRSLDGTSRSELNMNLLALDLMHTMDPHRIQRRSNPSASGVDCLPTTKNETECGAETKTRSATRIQATFRGFLLRKKQLITLYEDHISALEDRLRTQMGGSDTSSMRSVRTQKEPEGEKTDMIFERERVFGTQMERDQLRTKLDECQQSLSMANWRVQDLTQELERTKENCAKLHSSLTLANRSSKDLSSHLAIATRALDAQTSRSAALSATLSSIRQSLPADHPLASNSETSEPHGPLATVQHELETERARCLLKTGECEELRMQIMGLKREVENDRNFRQREPEEFRRSVGTNSESIGSWASVNASQRAGTVGSAKNKGGGYRTVDNEGRIGMCIVGGGGSSTLGNATAAARRLAGTSSSSREKDLIPDWQLLIEKIVKTNDQQSSLFLQQRLKTACQDVKQAIMDVILPHSLSLMKNKFGNFLMQRCFEYGTRVQTSALASTMRGNVLSLALDPFGCHVAQKALDNVDEDVKASMVSEMLVRRIPETIIHRFASHVWQRVFEIRWTGAAGAPAVMNYVHGALQMTWHQVAIEENGSLVVQNIFENCSEAEKRPVLREILDQAPRIARGEFGNWVIQHILEHGAPADRRRIIRIILEDLPHIGTDQYSSKVVEKALKTATRSEVQEIADRLCRIDPPDSYPVSFELEFPLLHRSGPFNSSTDPNSSCSRGDLVPLLALVADQYGNYVVQHLLHVAPAEQRERVAQWVRPHLSALRASKYGQKVAQIVERMSRSADRVAHVPMHNHSPLNQQLPPGLHGTQGPMAVYGSSNSTGTSNSYHTLFLSSGGKQQGNSKSNIHLRNTMF